MIISPLVLFLLVLIVPTASALARDGNISVSPKKDEAGDEIEIRGHGFNTSDYVYLFFSSYEADEGDDMSDLDAYEYLGRDRTGYLGSSEEGSFEMTVEVPDELTNGKKRGTVGFGIYYVYASYDDEGDDIIDSDEFSIIGIKLNPAQGDVGSKVKVIGAGFTHRD